LEEYGYNDEPIAAQTMLTTYRRGMDIGDVESYGIFDKLFKGGAKAGTTAAEGATKSGGGVGIAVDAVVGLTTAAIGVGAGLAQGKKQREHEAAMMQAEADLIAQQQELAAMQAGGGTSPWVWVVGGTIALGVVGGGVWFFTRKK
jgi:hypothetical protein